MSNNSDSSLLGFLLGGIIGGILALLFARSTSISASARRAQPLDDQNVTAWPSSPTLTLSRDVKHGTLP